jgi:hypothetical protein
MKIHIYHHISQFDDKEFHSKLNSIIQKLNQIMAGLQTIQEQNTALIAAVAAEDSVIDSAVTLISGFGATLASLQQQLADAIANGVNAADVQAVADSMAATVTDINTKKDALAAAVTANTPSA